MNEEITESVYYQRGYDKGFSDAQEKLALELDQASKTKEDLIYKKGYKAGEKKAKEIYDPNKRKSKT